jgi:hypothetical protein
MWVSVPLRSAQDEVPHGAHPVVVDVAREIGDLGQDRLDVDPEPAGLLAQSPQGHQLVAWVRGLISGREEQQPTAED